MTPYYDTAGPRVMCTVCGSIIRSMYRHDFRYCECGRIAVDGGNSYLRTLGDPDYIKVLDDPYEGKDSPDESNL